MLVSFFLFYLVSRFLLNRVGARSGYLTGQGLVLSFFLFSLLVYYLCSS